MILQTNYDQHWYNTRGRDNVHVYNMLAFEYRVLLKVQQ